jgi:hypothetical protein
VKLQKIFFILMIFGVALMAPGTFRAQTADIYYTVTIYKVGNGSGTVVSSPPGIDCGDGFNDCSAQFVRGTPVTLSPRALHGPSIFQGWSVAVGSTMPCAASSGDCSFIVTENSSARAQFVLD